MSRPLVCVEPLETRTLLSVASSTVAPSIATPGQVAPLVNIPAPTGLQITNVAQTSVSLAWDQSPYNEYDPQNTYNVYELVGGQYAAVLKGLSGTATTIGNLTPATPYTFAITLVDSDGNESPLSSSVSATTFGAPTITHPDPDHVPVHATAGVLFTYALAATGYPVPTFSVVSGPNGLTVDPNTGLVSWTPTADQAGTATFTIAATNSVDSAQLTTTISVAPLGTDSTPPSVVTGVTFSNPTRTGTDISWNAATDNVGVDHYRIRVYTADAVPQYMFTVDTPTAATTYTLSNSHLAPAMTYNLKVTAVDAASSESDVASTPLEPFPTLLVDVIPPTAPGLPIPSDITATTAQLTWGASTDNFGVAGYDVFRRTAHGHSGRDGGITYTNTLIASSPTNSITLTGLTPRSSYWLFVRAFDAAGNFSGYSPIVTVNTLPLAVSIPGTGGDDTIYLKDPAGTLEWWVNHDPASQPAPDGSAVLGYMSNLTILGNGGNDSVIFLGDTGLTSLDYIGGVPITYSGIAKVGFGDGSVSIASLPPGMGLIATGTANVFLAASVTVPSLDVTGSANVTLGGAGGSVLEIGPNATVSSLNIVTPATKGPTFVGLDLGANGLVVEAADAATRDSILASVSSLIAQARNTKDANGVLWGGDGIRSSTAAAEAALDTSGKTGLTGIAVVPNIALDPSGNVTGPLKTTFKGVGGLDANAVLAGYTLNGDTNLDGVINFDDYFRINSGFLSNGALSGYRFGDLNLDGQINFDDYFLINSAFLGQSGHAPIPPMTKVASPFSTKQIRASHRKLRPGKHARHLAQRG